MIARLQWLEEATSATPEGETHAVEVGGWWGEGSKVLPPKFTIFGPATAPFLTAYYTVSINHTRQFTRHRQQALASRKISANFNFLRH